MNYKELQDFIKAVAKTGVSEVNVKTDEIKLNIKVHSDEKPAKHTETIIQQVPVGSPMTNTGVSPQQPVQQTPPAGETQKEEEAKEEAADASKYIEIKSPMVGTFYRKPAPDKETFVNVGDTVKEDSVVCIIEAMKLFNEIEAEVSGKIVKILVDDSTPVEFEQPLMLVEPA
jgi:acetyl-CoA carboxylase biotin carboxyl carrier protein